MSLIKSIITSLIGNLLAKLIFILALVIVSQGLFFHLKNKFKDQETSFGTSLAQAVKYDYHLISSNQDEILETTTKNVNDFNQELTK